MVEHLSTTRADVDVSLLEVLRDNPDAAQRDMAEAIGLSLGMTNLLLKTLSERGWLMISRVSPRKLRYLLTPEGITELSRRSYRYLKKTIRVLSSLRLRVEALVAEAKQSGALGLHLVGDSELDFVLESLCRQHGVSFRLPSVAVEPGWWLVHGENEPQARPNVLEYLEAHHA